MKPLSLLALFELLAASALPAQPTITEYRLPTRSSGPTAIAKGPDGNLWVVESGSNAIAKVGSDGVATEYSIPTPSSQPFGITAGPDGNVWFTEASGNKIGKISPNGKMTEYPLPVTSAYPASITLGADGNLWFIEERGIGKITADGALTEYPFSGVSWFYGRITTAPSGDVWFTATDEVGRISRSGTITRFPLLATNPGTGSLSLRGIAAAADGSIWVAGNALWKIAGTGTATPNLFLKSSGEIGAGPDGNLWSGDDSGRLYKITTSGVFTQYSVSEIPGGLSPGPDGNLWFTEPGSGKVAKIVLSTVPTDNLLAINPASLTFTGGSDGSAPAAQTLTVSSSGPTPISVWGAPQFSDWLTLSSYGSLIANQRITVSARNLATPGVYFGSIWITSGNVTQTVQVTLSATGLPVSRDIYVSPAFLNFTYPPQLTQQLQITNVDPRAGAIPLDISYTIFQPTGGHWLTLTNAGPATAIPNGGAVSSPVTMIVQVDPAGLPPGVYGASITIAPNGGSPVKIPLTVLLTAPPPPSVKTVLNAASFAPSPVVIAPGEIVTISGTGLGPSNPIGLAVDSNGAVATSLAGVNVSFNNYAAPLIYVSAGQINCVVPYEIEGASDVSVQVSYGGQAGRYQMKGVAIAPAVFTANGSGVGTVAAANSAGGYNDVATPAPAGSTVTFYLTGEGQTNPRGVTGKITTPASTGGGPLTPQSLAAPTVVIGGKAAKVTFFGEAPGLVSGIMQLNVQIPEDLPGGSQPLKVSFGDGSATQNGVVIWIR